jgi:vancomycin resistance protein YoaR
MRVKIRRKILFSSLIFFLILFSLFLALEIFNYNKIAYGVSIAGIKVGGLTKNQAKDLLNTNFEDWQNKNIVLAYQEKSFLVLPGEIGISFGLQKTIDQAYAFGRSRNILIGITDQIAAVFSAPKSRLAPVYFFDQEKFEKLSKEKFTSLENPAQNASLVYDFQARSFETTPASEGFVFDREKLKKDLIKALDNLDNSAISLKLIKDYPDVSESETQQAKENASQILANAPFYLKYNDKTWAIDKATLLDWLEFKPVTDTQNSPLSPPTLSKGGIKGGPNKILGVSLNQDKIKDILDEISPSINQETINAQLAFSEGKVTAFSLPQDGIRVDLEASAKKINDALTSPGGFGLASAPAGKNIDLIVIKRQPVITLESINILGLTSLLGTGTSSFSGSHKSRIHNIQVGSEKFNGLIIKPGEEFSFDDNLGEVGPKQGYLPELVIKQGKTIPEYGGGLCQVSTTVFRAAVNSGLKITERHPHAFPVKYYNPQGFDATIYPPSPDLKFINDTPNNILLQSKIEGNKLTFEIYGTADGREVKIKGPTILQANRDGSMKTIFYQEIWRNGQMERQDKFPSNYKSPALYPVIQNPLE